MNKQIYYQKHKDRWKKQYYKYNKKGRQLFNCLNCQKQTLPTSPNQKYCLSKDCRRALKRNWYKLNKPCPPLKNCLICKIPFLFGNRKKFCSIQCYAKSIKYIPRPPHFKKCIICGEEFETNFVKKNYGQKRCIIHLADKTDRPNLRQRFKILKRDNFTCQYCGRKPPEVILHIDHKKPRSKGGNNNETNLITACSLCNLGKSNLFW